MSHAKALDRPSTLVAAERASILSSSALRAVRRDEFDAELAADERIASLESERDDLRASYERLHVELELYRGPRGV
ncbi:MAG: hypothetical protein QM778_20340 [Myxococcales bacterium]